MAIPREAYLQEAMPRFAKAAIAAPPVFLAFDRAEARGQRSHLYQARRGVRAGTSDTLTIAAGIHLWWEAKAKGSKPTDTQQQFGQNVVAAGDYWSWGTSIADYLRDLRECGIPVVASADYLAMHWDGIVESRIAKAEQAQGTVKRTAQRKAVPRNSMTAAQYHKAHGEGFL
jgi:hypothetical protein